MTIELPHPHKLLWPNGSRGNHRAVAGQKAKHKGWAMAATWGAGVSLDGDDREVIPVRLIVHAKPKGPLPDRDNCVAAAKTYLDGISAAMKVNDRRFAAPVVTFALPRDGRFVFEVG